MHFSKSNILIELNKEDEWKYVLFNSLVGNVDFLNEEYYRYIQKLKDLTGKTKFKPDPEKDQQLSSRGYLFEDEEAEKEKDRAFIEFYLNDRAEKKGNVYAVIPQNTCGFNCSYCKYRHLLDGASMSEEDFDKIMDFIVENEKKDRLTKKPILGLWGNESFPDTDESFARVKKILHEYIDHFAHISFSTSGFNIARYKELLLDPQIIEKISFKFLLMENDAMMKEDQLVPPAVASTLEWLRMHGMRTILYVKITEDNIGKMPDYINYFIEKGVVFSENCALLFKPTFKENCSLYGTCNTNYDLYERIFQIYEEYPQLEFGNFSGGGMVKVLQYLLKTRERFSISTLYCDAIYNLYMFDPRGNIYACYQALQNPELAVGNIHHNPVVDEAKLEQWRKREVLALEECTACPAKFVCAGGCAYEALKQKGTLHACDCQPYQNILKWAFESLHEDFLETDRYLELEDVA